VSAPAKANKQDLIARILASPAALGVYNKLQNPTLIPVQQSTVADDLLAPPEDFDWEGDETAPAVQPAAKMVHSNKPSTKEPAKPAKPTKPASKSAAKPASPAKKPAAIAAQTVEPLQDDTAVVDEELEKRKKRAARFGVPLVESRKLAPPKSGSNTLRKASATPTAPLDNPENLRARAARFGTAPTKPVAGRKRPAEEVVDAEELEKRKKRAERFGMPTPKA